MMLGLLSALLSGCARVTTECDWTRIIRFSSQQTIDWLLQNDRQLLAEVVAHNEAKQEVCR